MPKCKSGRYEEKPDDFVLAATGGRQFIEKTACGMGIGLGWAGLGWEGYYCRNLDFAALAL
ncbi:MAG: hypothetical protein ACR65O_08190 [Methylomicrobium sp.]